jgi:D-alanine-D-alanine ligase
MQVGVVFGGRSVEHDVSIITGIQACEALSARHTPVALYVDRQGRWFSGEGVRRIEDFRGERVQAEEVGLDLGSGTFVPRAAGKPRGMLSRSRAVAEPFRPDVVINATHGTQGEDGCLQGAFELANLPYAGPNLESAALAMNKVITKRVLRAVEVPVLDDLTIGRAEYKAAGAAALVAKARSRFGFPVYVKPASLGSSVGVSRCLDDQALADGLELAFELDRVALVEPAVDGGMEINCAVLGRPGAELRTSACEQPVGSTEFLSFEDKYLREDKTGSKGGALKREGMSSAQRVIPAPISDEQTAEAQSLAKRTFEALGCTGVARVDLLLDAHGRLFVNECNTIPGSFAFYLWEPVGLDFPALLDELIEIALAEHEEKAITTRIFESSLLSGRAAGGKT